MLPKPNRVKTEKEFKQVFRNSKKFETEHFKIFIQKVENNSVANIQKIKSMYDENGKFVGSEANKLEISNKTKSQSGKLGVIISAKHGKAHDRNKCKRRIRNLLYPYIKNNSVNLVIQIKANIKNLEFERLREEVMNYLPNIQK